MKEPTRSYTTSDDLTYACDAAASVVQKARLGKGITVMHIYPAALRSLLLALPPDDEQAAIVRYLDHVDSRIQRFIAAKARLGELVEEEKQAIIHRAVTRGLDPGVPTRASDVTWLGEIPNAWGLARLKSICSMRAGGAIQAEAIEERGEFPVYGGNGIRGYTDSWTHRGEYLLVGRQGALCGNVHRVRGTFWASEHAVVVTPREGVDIGWLDAALRAMNLNQYSISAAQPGLAVDRIRDLGIGTPPLNEQREIAKAIAHDALEKDRVTHQAHRHIALLREYRTRLISDVVTGKRDVRDAAANLPDNPGADDAAFDDAIEEAIAA